MDATKGQLKNQISKDKVQDFASRWFAQALDAGCINPENDEAWQKIWQPLYQEARQIEILIVLQPIPDGIEKKNLAQDLENRLFTNLCTREWFESLAQQFGFELPAQKPFGWG
jgi:hypothetical protein